MLNSILANSIPACVLRVAGQNPDNIAFVDPPSLSSAPITYGEFRRKVVALAIQLRHCGVEARDRVGIVSTGRSWWAISDMAIMAAEAVTVPVYPSLPASQVGYIVRHSGMTGIFVENLAQYEKLLAANRDETLPIRFIVTFDDAHWLDELNLDAPWHVYRYANWTSDIGYVDDKSLSITSRLDRSQAATIVYTSGTTGLPKGVVLTHGNILANIEGIRERVELVPNDIHLSYLPLSHILERTCGLYIPLQSGATIAYAQSIDSIAADFVRVRPTTFTTVPRLLEKVQERIMTQVRSRNRIQQTLFERALRMGEKAYVLEQNVSKSTLFFYERLVFAKLKQAMGGHLRLVVSGGAPLSTHVARFFCSIGIPVCEGYGMTETSPVIAFNSPTDKHLGTVGRKLWNVEIQLAEDGELFVKGPSVTKGYFLNPQADAEAFTDDGWLRTGDIATVSDDGYLTITDRKKHLIVLSTGKKVTPAPIENSIVSSPYIDQACLVGQGRKCIAVVIVPTMELIVQWMSEDGRNLRHSADEMRDLLRQEVKRTTQMYATFEQPKDIVIAQPFTIDNGMLTPTLKIKANRVCEMYAKEIDVLYESMNGVHRIL